VRLGITAPRNVVVDRSEVHQRKLAEYLRVRGAVSAVRRRVGVAPLTRRIDRLDPVRKTASGFFIELLRDCIEHLQRPYRSGGDRYG
jgi:hypothetical protein